MNETTVTAIISALSGMVGLELVRRGFNLGEHKQADGVAIRHELWEEIEKLRKRIDVMQTALDTANREMVRLQVENTEQRAEIKMLRAEVERLRQDREGRA